MHLGHQPAAVFGDEPDDEPEPDGRRFDAVTRYEEPAEPDPDALGPDIPEPDEDTPARVPLLFWRVVVVFNLAILAIALGALMLVFDRRPTLGGQILVLGFVLLGYGLYRYRGAKREIAALTADEGKG